MHRTGWLSGLAAVALAAGVVAFGSDSMVRIAAGSFGTVLLAAGILRRQRQWLAIGTFGLALAATLAAMDGLRFDALVMMAGAILAWDLGENTISLAIQVEDGRVGRAVGIHVIGGLVVGAVGIVIGMVIASSQGILLPLPAFLLALLAITFLIAVFR